MASGPITSWQIKGGGGSARSDKFYFLGLQNHCRQWPHPWNKRCLLLERRTMTTLNSVLKSRDITSWTKVCTVKAMVFPVVMYRCESWTVKKAECQRIGAFKLWCRRRLLRVPWTAKRSNQSILKKINLEYSSEGVMPRLKLEYSGHLMRRADSLEKTLMLGKTEDKKEKGAAEDEMVV